MCITKYCIVRYVSENHLVRGGFIGRWWRGILGARSDHSHDSPTIPCISLQVLSGITIEGLMYIFGWSFGLVLECLAIDKSTQLNEGRFH